MSTRSLYHVTVTLSFYAVSDDERSLDARVQQYASACAADAEPDEVRVRKVEFGEQIPEDWQGCYPYGDTSTTVGAEVAKLRSPCSVCGAEWSSAGVLKHAEGCEAWGKDVASR